MQLHATTVAMGSFGLLILGPSGSGKTTLALQMMAAGADLVSDDRTDLIRKDAAILASCPKAILGRIEARGIGILNSTASAGPVQLAQVVDLGHATADRLPHLSYFDLLGVSLPLVRTSYRPHLYAALRQLLLGGRFA